ncbi:flagellar brake protein [Erwinia sp. JUb26]|uniref:flagellar brake protein n=1 Tax=Erwinia sp. JUb26 TaxID=2485126 RepID=UPI000F47D4CE|nr:PilZ domain-containing protein [Erwinia sp. JUb26]ROR13606.1 PilZ domain-containing protein [Erwinia sp. JUb26]
MSVGILKESKYEILAILREECRVKSEIDIYYQGELWAANIKKVDFSCFYINPGDTDFSSIIDDAAFSFVLHSQLGKIEFSAVLNTACDRQNTTNAIAFFLPDRINILQRRLTQRVRVKNDPEFFCSGRHKSGESYKCTINDLSEGGCSFISDSFKKKFMDKGMALDNVEISLAEYGIIVTSLKVVNVTPVYQDRSHERSVFRISCKFNYKNPETKKYIEDTVLKITVDQKLKARRF